MHYRYTPSVFRRAPDLKADALYVVGGLYGNAEALTIIEALYAQEPSTRKQLVFNGDHHWFDADLDWFKDIEQRVGRHFVLRGNVETELSNTDNRAGCGCAYPDSVSNDAVERSNRILQRLRNTAQSAPDLVQQLQGRPMHAVAQIGALRIAIVHGDAYSLAGWQFDAKALQTSEQAVYYRQLFAEAQVQVFASSHTCEPVLQFWKNVGAVINNGAAGMPNLPVSRHGIMTRIATTPPVQALHSVVIQGIHISAVAIPYDHQAWQARFSRCWPPDSDAEISYGSRIRCHEIIDHPSCAE